MIVRILLDFLRTFTGLLTNVLTFDIIQGVVAITAIGFFVRMFDGTSKEPKAILLREDKNDDDEEWILVRRRR